METTERRQEAIERKHAGCNCCQAVLCAFADRTEYTEEQLFNMGAAFGVGMGGLEGTCGALVAAELLLGMTAGERPVMRDARMLHKAFTDTCGASLCKDLKGRDTGKVLCPCDDCVRCAVDLIEEKTKGE
jgi:C_GCAxxG_C_C family probable redox protein